MDELNLFEYRNLQVASFLVKIKGNKLKLYIYRVVGQNEPTFEKKNKKLLSIRSIEPLHDT